VLVDVNPFVVFAVPLQVWSEGIEVWGSVYVVGKLERLREEVNTLGGLIYLQDSVSEQR